MWRAQLNAAVFASPFAAKLMLGATTTKHIDGHRTIDSGRVTDSSENLAGTACKAMVCVCDTSGCMRLLDLADGSTLSETQLPGEVFSSPVLRENAIVVGCRDDHVYSFSLSLHGKSAVAANSNWPISRGRRGQEGGQ